MDATADDDVVRILADGRSGLDYDAFRALIPDWPQWLKIDGRDFHAGPESGVVYHTRHGGRRYAIVAPRNSNIETDLRCHLYGITDGLLSFTWTPLRAEQATDTAALQELVRWLRRSLPEVLADSDRSVLGRDGELDAWDRRYEGARLRWKAYYRWDDNWGHDHCVYCGATFSLDEPGALTAGFAIQGHKHGDDHEWICGPCVDARRGLVAFDVVEDEA